jgi:hypothetical protein
VLTHVEGTREDALVELERRARRHTPEHPRSPKRRRLFQEGDGFLLVIDGAWQSFSRRFTVAELLRQRRTGPAVGGRGAASALDAAGGTLCGRGADAADLVGPHRPSVTADAPAGVGLRRPSHARVLSTRTEMSRRRGPSVHT